MTERGRLVRSRWTSRPATDSDRAGRPITAGGTPALLLILAIAAILRVAWNDVAEYSPADEAVYTSYAQTLHDKGFISAYPEISGWFLNDPKMARFPNPMRFGYLALATLSVEMYGASEPHALAWLSTISGFLVVPLLFFLGKRMFGVRAGLLAAAFAAVSPLELALGRRALQDEVFCLAVLAAVTVVIVAPKRLVLAMIAMAAALSIKESFLLLLPAFLPLVKQKRQALLFVVPPAFNYLALAALAHDFTAPVRMAKIVWGATAARYVVQYQGGPPHRYLFDFFMTSPFVSLLAVAAVFLFDKRIRSIALFVIIAIATMSIIPSKNLRFIVMLDPMIRLLAAWFVASRAWNLVAIGIANAAIELELFYTIFIRGGVYDPVTQSMLEAVGAVPRDNPAADHSMLFPWICAVVALFAWLQNQYAGRPASKMA